MMNRENALGKRGMLFALIAAMVMALVLSFSMAQPAEAASTSKPYAGYKNSSKEVVDAGNIYMRTYDPRKVKAGYDSFYVWSGNSKLWDAKGNYVKASKAFKTLKGMSYNKKSNTLTLKNVKAPTYTLSLRGMGTGFKIKLVGKNSLAGIESEYATKYNSKGEFAGQYPSSLTITGTGSLELNKNKYNYAAISLSAYGTASKIVIDKKANLKLYAYGTSNVITASSTTQKKASAAVTIKGWVSDSMYWVSQTNKPHPYYESGEVTVVETAASTYSLYKIGTAAQLYYLYDSYNSYESVDTGRVDEYGDPIYEDKPILQYVLYPVKLIGSSKYYVADRSKSSITKKSTEVTSAGSAKVITDTYGYNYMTKLNGGKFYASAGSKNVRYWDPSTRTEINSKWHIYKTIATIDGVAYITSLKDNVANKGFLPKGYKAKKSSGVDKTTYTHVLKNSMLTISA